MVGAATASIRICTPADRPYPRGCAAITSVAGRSPGARQTYRIERLSISAPTRKTATASTGRFVTPTFRRGTTASRRFAGISGASEGLEQLPDGQFLQPHGTQLRWNSTFKQQARERAIRRAASPSAAARISPSPPPSTSRSGAVPASCATSASAAADMARYFSTLSRDAAGGAERTGNLTVVTDAIVERLDYDHAKRRISGVRVIDANTKQAQVVPGTRGVPVRLDHRHARRSCCTRNRNFPERSRESLGRRSAAISWITCVASAPSGTHPGFLDRYYYGRRPTGFYHSALRQRHRRRRAAIIVRGCGVPGLGRAHAAGIARSTMAGVGAELKTAAARARPWQNGAVRLRRDAAARGQSRDAARDAQADDWGLPLVHIDCTHGENERRSARSARQGRAAQMLVAAGLRERPRADRASVAAGQSRPRDGHRAHGARSGDLGAQPATTRRTTSRTSSSPTARA